MSLRCLLLALVLSLGLASSGCSVRRLAVDAIGDGLVSGPSVYETDGDIQLVGEALPFSIKFVETLIAQSPQNLGLLLAASRAYLLYAYAYVQYEAEQVVEHDVGRAREIGVRAHKLFIRAFDYALRGLEVDHPGFRKALAAAPEKAVATVGNPRSVADVDLLYAAAAALAGAIGTAKQDATMLARLAEVDALLTRALALDESWNVGALHEFATTWYAARPGIRDREKIQWHYARAVALSEGKRAGPHVAYAEGVAIADQNRKEFEASLKRALAVDLDADPNSRLLNALAQRRAHWLRSRTKELFLE